jgi:hypothetical protein
VKVVKIMKNRGVAQPGSALHWGCSGRKFKSCRPDQYLSLKTTIYVSPHIFYPLVSGLFTQHLPSYFNDRHFFTPHAEYNLSALINNQGDSSGTWWR